MKKLPVILVLASLSVALLSGCATRIYRYSGIVKSYNVEFAKVTVFLYPVSVDEKEQYSVVTLVFVRDQLANEIAVGSSITAECDTNDDKYSSPRVGQCLLRSVVSP